MSDAPQLVYKVVHRRPSGELVSAFAETHNYVPGERHEFPVWAPCFAFGNWSAARNWIVGSCWFWGCCLEVWEAVTEGPVVPANGQCVFFHKDRIQWMLNHRYLLSDCKSIADTVSRLTGFSGSQTQPAQEGTVFVQSIQLTRKLGSKPAGESVFVELKCE